MTLSNKEQWERCFQQSLLCKGVPGTERKIKRTSSGGLQHADHSEVPPKHRSYSTVPVMTTLKPTTTKDNFAIDLTHFGSSIK